MKFDNVQTIYALSNFQILSKSSTKVFEKKGQIYLKLDEQPDGDVFMLIRATVFKLQPNFEPKLTDFEFWYPIWF